MKFIFYLFFFLPIISFGQENYPWKNIESISFYDFSGQGFDCNIDCADKIPTKAKPIICSVADWKEPLNNLSLLQYDLRSEPCYVLLIKFSNNLEIPFQYFPNQKVLMDLRPDMWINMLCFDKKAHAKLEELFIRYTKKNATNK